MSETHALVLYVLTSLWALTTVAGVVVYRALRSAAYALHQADKDER